MLHNRVIYEFKIFLRKQTCCLPLCLFVYNDFEDKNTFEREKNAHFEYIERRMMKITLNETNLSLFD